MASVALLLAEASSGGGGGGASDPDFSNVVLLMGFEGANLSTGSPGMDDESLSAHGTAIGGTTIGSHISTTQKKFGSSSLLLSGDSIHFTDSADFNFGADPFTVETFIRPDSGDALTGIQFIVGQWMGPGNLSWILYVNGNNLAWNTSTTGTDNNFDITASSTLALDTQYHAAVDYDGSKYRLYQDGVMVGSFATPRTLHDSPNNLSIGSNSNSGASWLFAYLDELRITKGVARYASDSGFSVPTSAFPRS